MTAAVPFRILAITPPRPDPDAFTPARVRALVDAWRPMLPGAGGPGLALLLREPGASPERTLAISETLRGAAADADIPVLFSIHPNDLEGLNALPQVTLEGVRGVQLKADAEPRAVARAREIGRATTPWWVGRSCHGAPPEQLGAADYECFAPVFTPRTKQLGVDKQAAGLDALRPWVARGVPVFALGGLTPDNAARCLSAGAHGVAGISLFFGDAGLVADNAAQLCAAFRRAPARHAAPP